MGMDWGVHLPQLGRSASGENVKAFAIEAERLGFHSGWVSDHVAWPREIDSNYPYSEDGSFPGGFDMPWLDPLGTLLFVAGVTERMQLGVTVMIMGYRPPVLSAKLYSTLDVMSGGRAIVGAGVGWMREEFEVLGMPFDKRGKRADEQLEIYERLFRDELPSYEGEFYQFPEIGFSPKPPRGHIPVWVGGDSEAAYRRTVRFGEALHAAFQPLDVVERAWKRVQEIAVEQGRDPGELRLSLRTFLDFDRLQPAEKSIQGSTDEMLERIAEIKAIGCDHVLLDIVARGGIDGRTEAMQRFMTEVAPQVD